LNKLASETFAKSKGLVDVVLEPACGYGAFFSEKFSQEKLPYYCYVDIFKDIANKLPYYFGNLDVPFDKNNFEKLKDDFFALSIAKHPDIFAGKFSVPNPERINFAKTKVQTYFNKLFKGINICL